MGDGSESANLIRQSAEVLPSFNSRNTRDAGGAALERWNLGKRYFSLPVLILSRLLITFLSETSGSSSALTGMLTESLGFTGSFSALSCDSAGDLCSGTN